MKKSFLYIAALLFFVSCSANYNTIIFSVMGDVPRSNEEDILIQEQIKQHNEVSNSEFMFHVGDIKSGNTPCSEDVYVKVSGYLKQLNVPTFIVPGDNEWNDCPDPESAWNFWIKHFMDFEKNWDLNLQIGRQDERKENFAFNYKGILFIGINLVGGLIHDSTEWKLRHRQNCEWIENQFTKNRDRVRVAVLFAQANPDDKHIDFMKGFLESAERFSKPIIFIHGDGHKWIYEENWKLPNIIRIQVDKGGIAPPLEVTVLEEGYPIVSINRDPFPDNKN